MPALTPKQIAQLMQILRDASTAVAVSTTGYEISEEERKRLEAEGYLEAGAAVADIASESYLFGRLMRQVGEAQNWTYAEFQKHLKANPVELSPAERESVTAAQQRAGMYCLGLGNRFSGDLSDAIVQADTEFAAMARQAIQDKTAEGLARRQTTKQLATQLGQITQDWARDWDRIAKTETHMAHQEGVLSETIKRHGDDELLAKVPEPDACPHCLKHYLKNGKPRVEPASWWQSQGSSNAGRKAKDWKPVLGAMHPFCRCQLLRIPEGWGFDESWDLVPLDVDEEDTEKSCASKGDELQKARKLHGRMKFQGFDISVENRAGSVRHWYDKSTETEGQTKMIYPYGYIRLTEGTDGDHVDVFVGPHEKAKNAYVIHQMRAPDFKTFDEDKVMLGFRTARAAKSAYLKHFDNPGFFGSMTVLPVEEFRKKVYRRKGQIIKGQQMELPLEAIDQLDLWKSAVQKVGIRPEDFHLVVKYARKGHAGAREALDRVQALVKAQTGQGYPVNPASSHVVGTMGNFGDPARTAGEVVRSPKQAAPVDEWPPAKKDKRKRPKRDLERPQDKLDVVGLKQGHGWAREFRSEDVAISTGEPEPQPTTEARENLEVQQRSRMELRQGSKLSSMEIHP